MSQARTHDRVRAALEIAGLIVIAALVAVFVAQAIGYSEFGFRQGLVIGGIVTIGYLISLRRAS